jgi:site-specific DNA-methyltransferase (adenine-specific)
MTCTILPGDCIESLQTLDRESVDLVVTDPPYNIGIDYGSGAKADRRPGYDLWCQQWIGGCYRALKPGGDVCHVDSVYDGGG